MTPAQTEEVDVRGALALLRERADEWLRLPALGKAGLVAECIPRLLDVAPDWVAAGIRAKQIPNALAIEEWLAGPVPTLRLARLFVASLRALGEHGRPPLGTGISYDRNGRLCIEALPTGLLDRSLFAGFRGTVICADGVDERAAREAQAERHRDPDATGCVVLILGAGNVSSIPAMDALSKLCGEGKVCLLKMNPVNSWLGPYLERGLFPLISRGFLRIVFGGAELGAELVDNPGIDEIHITGSDKTYDRIVWGDDAEASDRRKQNAPRIRKPITSELGNVSPVAIVPAHYSEAALGFQAQNVVAMVTNNASFNCNAAKLLVTSPRWPQRQRFLQLIADGLAQVPPRHAYYPGAKQRYDSLLAGQEQVRTFGQAGPGKLPWALICNVDGKRKDDRLFRTEPFCGLITDVMLGSSDQVEFLHSFTDFANDTVWGTLNACIVIPPELERDPVVSRHLEQTIAALRYGTIAINHWPAVGYASGSLPWGGHPSSTPQDIQSGVGWVHNTFMLAAIEKVVLRGPLTTWAYPPWFSDHPHAAELGPELARVEAGSYRAIPSLFWNAIRR